MPVESITRIAVTKRRSDVLAAEKNFAVLFDNSH
jgi:hypothetical protein